ncbi:MAG: ACT domain-containing protein, partial [Planctomycetota bacterium]|nr:ACT domain-containing protein [Planctomycetota bacterium]
HAQPNFVRAQILGRHGFFFFFEQTRPGRGAFASSIRAHLTTRDGDRVVAGTLFGENMPRLVQLGEHQLEAFLDGHLLIFQHSDVPGIIGAVGTICGRYDVNIAQMAVGRASPGGEAIGILNLDGPASTTLIKEIDGHEAISRVRCIELPASGSLPLWLEPSND